MSLFTKLFEAVHSWRRRRIGTKPARKRSEPTMEQLDHRQLLAVNFTGVAANDFPVTTSPGVQVITGVPVTQGGNNTVPLIPPALSTPGLVTVSGFQIDQLRVSYTADDDTLNIGVEGPNNTRDVNEVIAGDVDNNGNSGTVDPNVSAVDPGIQDPADMGGTETYGVSLSFNNSMTPDVVAGFPIGSQTDTSAKPFEVARALPTGSNSNLPQFDQTQVFPQYTGNYYLANDPTRPNFELQIPNFSQLYQQITGTPLTATSPISIGAFASSQQSGGISEEVFAPLPLNFPQATVPIPVPPPVVVVPPMAPTVFINYHADNHVNTAHNGPIRVNVLGSSGFDPTTIIPSTVRLGTPATGAVNGATPILNFERNVNHDGFPDETFVFNGLNVNLPPGITDAQISGTTTSGQTFASTVRVFNRDASYYTQAQINAQQTRFARYDVAHGIDTSNGVVAPPTRVTAAAQRLATSAAINDLYNPFAGKKAPVQVNPGAVNGLAGNAGVSAASTTKVSIPRKHGQTTKGVKSSLGAAHHAKAPSLAQVFNSSPTILNLASGA